MRKGIFLCVVLVALSGCASQIAGYAAAGREELESFNDATGRGLKAAPCAMTVGAYHRTANPHEQEAIACLCGGPCNDTPERFRSLSYFGDISYHGS